MAKTVIALFDDLRHAHAAVDELRLSKNFSNRDITLMAHDADNRYSQYLREHDVKVEKRTGTEADKGAAAGAGVGAVVGGIAGFLIGTGVIFIPGLGPVLAAGPLASTLLGIAGGAVAGGLVGGLIGLGIPEKEAHTYAEGLRRGGTIVVLRTEEEFVDDAARILAKHHPVDIEKRAEVWREQGWSGSFEPTEEVYTADRISEEYATYPKVPAKRVSAYDYQPRDTANYYTQLEPDFRKHYEKNPGPLDYNTAQKGYRFGTNLGADSRFGRENWNAVEAQAHKQWAQQSEGNWDSFKHYVQYGWHKAKEEFWDATTMGGDGRSGTMGNGDRTETTKDVYSRHENEFRQHFASHASNGNRFDEVSPAYRVGAALGRNKRLANEDWNRVRAEAHKKWAASADAQNRPFDKVEEYIKYGWFKTKEELWDTTTSRS